MPRKPRTPLLVVLFSMALLSQACVFGRRALPSIPLPTSTPLVLPTGVPATAIPVLQNDSSTPRVVLSATLIYTPTAAPVMLKAVGGSLAIRRGPDPVFDAIAVLQDGQSAPVLARSIQDGWVEIPIPSQPGKTGWVSVKAGFSEVSGDVLDLPLITEVEWPFGAYLTNCTAHQVLLKPGDTVVPAVNAAPDNRVWFTPGLYTAYDLDVAGQPAITQLKLWSHTSLSLTKDGSGTKYTCP